MSLTADVHCHCLPGIDDGCKTKDESLTLLRQSKQDGIDVIFATPHYYRRMSIPDFLSKRQGAWEQIANEVQSPEYPRIILGAEVAYFNGIANEENLTQLCLGKSDFLLLELPTTPWTPQLFRDLYTLSSVGGVRLILAHLERYTKLQDKKALHSLYDMNLMIQMNAENLLHFSNRHSALKLLKSGKVDLLGSDAHNLSDRTQNLAQGYEVLAQKCPEEVHILRKNAIRVFESAT